MPLATLAPPLKVKTKPSGKRLRGRETQRQKARRWIVYLAFAVYWLLIFEGVLRKWALPGMSQILFFIRDPFVLAAYYLAYKHDLWPRRSAVFSSGLWLSVVFMGLVVIHAAMGSATPVILLYGWRNYFYYLPFAFLIGTHFRGKDLSRLIKHTLIASVPIAILCYEQFKAPAEDALNGSSSMLVAQGIVRTSGTFSCAAAQAIFVGSIFAMLLCVWLLPAANRPLKGPLLWLSTLAVLTTVSVAGARSAFMYLIMVVAGALVATIVINIRRLPIKKLIVVPTIVLVFALGYMTLFPTAYSAMVERQTLAQAAEGSTLLRGFGGFTNVFQTFDRLSVIGLGPGVGSNANAMTSDPSHVTFMVAEDEWSRIALEAGVFGFLYIGYRVWLVCWLFKRAFLATKRSYNPAPLLLISFAALNLLIGQMTMQGTINGFGWLFMGFCMAANRLKMQKIGKSNFDLWA